MTFMLSIRQIIKFTLSDVTMTMMVVLVMMMMMMMKVILSEILKFSLW
jgi:hypothetical protein